MYLFVQYPKCSTCQKAKKWLEANDVEFVSRHIVEENPKADEIGCAGLNAAAYPLKNFLTPAV